MFSETKERSEAEDMVDFCLNLFGNFCFKKSSNFNMSKTEELDLQLIILKDDETTSARTKAVRYLDQQLHEAHDNPFLSTMVLALLQDQMKMTVFDEAVDFATTSKNPKGGDPSTKLGEWERSLPRETSPR